MTITIRKADEQDFPVILSLIKEFSTFQKTPEKVTVTLQQMIEGKDNFQCLIAETNNREIAGLATFFLPGIHGQAKDYILMTCL